MTPAGIGGSIAEGLRDLADAIGDFGADVRAAAAEREAELRAGTGLDAPLPTGDAVRAAEPGRALRLSGRPMTPRPGLPTHRAPAPQTE